MGMTTPVFAYAGFRIVDDDGTEANATSLALNPAAYNQQIDSTFRVRMLVQETAGGSVNNESFTWQYRHVEGTNTWTDITTTSSVCRAVNSQLVDDADTTSASSNRIGSGTYITDNSAQCEDGVTTSPTADFAGNDEVECEISVQVRGVDTSDGDTVEIRVLVAAEVPSGTVAKVLAANIDRSASIDQTLPGLTSAVTGTFRTLHTASIDQTLAGLSSVATGTHLKTYTGSIGGAGISFIDGTELTSSNTGNTTISINKPTGTQQGDLLIIATMSRNSYIGAPTGGAAWTEEEDYNVLVGSITTPSTSNDVWKLYTKIAGASEPSQYDFAITDDGTDAQVILCSAWRGASGIANFAALSNDIFTAPSINGSDGDVLISLHSTAFDLTPDTVTEPSGMTLINQAKDLTNDAGQAWAYEQLTATQTTGSRAWILGWDAYDLSASFVITPAGNPMLLAGLSSVMTGTFLGSDRSGSIAQTLPGMTSVATGTFEKTYSASITSTLGGLVSVATGTFEKTFTASVAQTLSKITSIATGTFVPWSATGTIDQLLPQLMSSATGTHSPPVFAGTIAQTLSGLTQSLTGTFAITWYGSIDQTLAGLTSVATGTHLKTYTVTIDQTLAGLTSVATGTYTPPDSSGSIDQTFAGLSSIVTGTFVGVGARLGAIDQTLAGLISVVTGTNVPGISTASIDQTLPGLTSVLTGTFEKTYSASIDQTLAGLISVVAATFTPPGTITGAIDQTLPGLLSVVTGTNVPGVSTGSIAQSLPVLSQTLSGTFEKTYSISIDQTFIGVTSVLTGNTGTPVVSGSIDQTLAGLVQTLTGTSAPPTFSGSAAQTLPGLDQTLTGTFEKTYTGSINQTLPGLIQSLWDVLPDSFDESLIWIVQEDNLIWISEEEVLVHLVQTDDLIYIITTGE